MRKKQSLAPDLHQYICELLAAFNPYQTPVSEPAVSPATASPVIQETLPIAVSLSARELEVLGLLDVGLSDREIAARLVVVVGTVKRYLNNIYNKLGVHSRTHALARARALSILS